MSANNRKHLYWMLKNECTRIWINQTTVRSTCCQFNTISRCLLYCTYQLLLVSLTLTDRTDLSLLNYSDRITQVKGKHLYDSNNPIMQNKHHSSRLRTFEKTLYERFRDDGSQWIFPFINNGQSSVENEATARRQLAWLSMKTGNGGKHLTYIYTIEILHGNHWALAVLVQ